MCFLVSYLHKPEVSSEACTFVFYLQCFRNMIPILVKTLDRWSEKARPGSTKISTLLSVGHTNSPFFFCTAVLHL